MEIKQLCTRLVKSPQLHARWLNSLSYLEYRGFRKIARSQRTEDIDEELLTHAMEEVRHALFFKKLAIKVGGLEFSKYRTETLLAEKALKIYFYDLDKGVEQLCALPSKESSKNLIYRFVTWIIEERAMSVYREYEKVLKDQNCDFSLRAVLADESKHLHEMSGSSKACLEQVSATEQALFQLEAECFAPMMQAIQRDVEINSPSHFVLHG